MPTITPDELSTRMEQGDDPYLLDIRYEDDFVDWHIPGSDNVDIYDELQEDPDAAVSGLETLPEDEEIITVCAAGELSDVATDALRERGYDARTLVDGMNGWSRVHRTAPVETALDGTLVQVARPGKGCLSHVLVSEGEAAVFDPSSYLDENDAVLDAHDATFVGVFDTHAHADHVSGGYRLADRHDVPYYLHPADAEGVQVTPLVDGRTVEVGNVDIEVLHTPGHSPGSVCFALDDEALLTGDTLFHESVGRVELGVDAGLEDTDVADNARRLYEGLQRLRNQKGDPLVLSAHDPGSPDPPVAVRMSEVEQRNDGLNLDREAFVETFAEDVPDQPPNFERIKRVNVGAETLDGGDFRDLETGPNNCAAE